MVPYYFDEDIFGKKNEVKWQFEKENNIFKTTLAKVFTYTFYQFIFIEYCWQNDTNNTKSNKQPVSSYWFFFMCWIRYENAKSSVYSKNTFRFKTEIKIEQTFRLFAFVSVEVSKNNLFLYKPFFQELKLH